MIGYNAPPVWPRVRKDGQQENPRRPQAFAESIRTRDGRRYRRCFTRPRSWQIPSTSCPYSNSLTELGFDSRIESRLFGRTIGESGREDIRLSFGGKIRSPGRIVTGNHYEPGTLTHCPGGLRERPRGCLNGAARSIPLRNSSPGSPLLNRRRSIPVNVGVEPLRNVIERACLHEFEADVNRPVVDSGGPHRWTERKGNRHFTRSPALRPEFIGNRHFIEMVTAVLNGFLGPERHTALHGSIERRPINLPVACHVAKCARVVGEQIPTSSRRTRMSNQQCAAQV